MPNKKAFQSGKPFLFLSCFTNYNTGNKTLSKTWITPLLHCTSVATMLLAGRVGENVPVIFGPPVRLMVIFCVFNVGTTPPPATTVGRLDAKTLPLITWYCSTLVNCEVLGVNGMAANSVVRLAKAVLVGAKTVNGPVPERMDTKLGCPGPVNAPTSEVKLGLAVAWVTMVGNPITALTMWITPLVAKTFAVVTDETPFNRTPLVVFTYMLKVLVVEALPLASVLM